jgi:hypothetical protein
MAIWLGMGAGSAVGEDSPVARISPSGESIELELGSHGHSVKQQLPLHRVTGARYFAAGVGLEERAATYPSFPLKIVFTAGGRPFLAGVAVTIRPAKGGSPIVIPREQVEGPWLFVDLPPGLYDVTATDGEHPQQVKGVKVEAGKQTVVHLRWPEDRGIAGRIPAE